MTTVIHATRPSDISPIGGVVLGETPAQLLFERTERLYDANKLFFGAFALVSVCSSIVGISLLTYCQSYECSDKTHLVVICATAAGAAGIAANCFLLFCSCIHRPIIHPPTLLV